MNATRYALSTVHRGERNLFSQKLGDRVFRTQSIHATPASIFLEKHAGHTTTTPPAAVRDELVSDDAPGWDDLASRLAPVVAHDENAFVALVAVAEPAADRNIVEEARFQCLDALESHLFIANETTHAIAFDVVHQREETSIPGAASLHLLAQALILPLLSRFLPTQVAAGAAWNPIANRSEWPPVQVPVAVDPVRVRSGIANLLT
jgi:hypothetical protein